MADEAKHEKLRRFTEAALTNPRHPVFQMGMAHSPILQHYALNVMVLEAVKPEDWFTQYPDYTAKLEEVMKLCEAVEETPALAPVIPAESDEVKALKAKVAELEGKLSAVPAPESAAPESA